MMQNAEKAGRMEYLLGYASNMRGLETLRELFPDAILGKKGTAMRLICHAGLLDLLIRWVSFVDT